MKKFGSFALVFLVVISTARCSVVRDSKDAQKMEKEGDGKIDELNQTNKSLADRFGIVLLSAFGNTFSSKSLADHYPWDKKTKPELNEIREILTAQRARAGRIQEIVSHKNIRWKGNPDDLTAIRANAQHYLDSLNRFESGEKSPKPVSER